MQPDLRNYVDVRHANYAELGSGNRKTEPGNKLEAIS